MVINIALSCPTLPFPHYYNKQKPRYFIVATQHTEEIILNGFSSLFPCSPSHFSHTYIYSVINATSPFKFGPLLQLPMLNAFILSVSLLNEKRTMKFVSFFLHAV